MTLPRILIVEDNYPDYQLLVEGFRELGVQAECIYASDGLQALDHLTVAADAQRPALVVLDINLPKLRGTEVLRRIRASQRYQAVPVVMLTSSKAQRDRDESAAADGFITKATQWSEQLVVAARLWRFATGTTTPEDTAGWRA